MVNYYHDMWPHKAHILTPLTLQTGAPKKSQPRKNMFGWKKCKLHLPKWKRLWPFTSSAPYPNHNKPFHIYTNASDYPLGLCVMQDSQPAAHHSKMLNNAQHHYSTVDKELLSIVMTLCEFWSMLLGAELHIHTNHKNILNIRDSS
jgi:hypothetical protein